MNAFFYGIDVGILILSALAGLACLLWVIAFFVFCCCRPKTQHAAEKIPLTPQRQKFGGYATDMPTKRPGDLLPVPRVEILGHRSSEDHFRLRAGYGAQSPRRPRVPQSPKGKGRKNGGFSPSRPGKGRPPSAYHSPRVKFDSPKGKGRPRVQFGDQPSPVTGVLMPGFVSFDDVSGTAESEYTYESGMAREQEEIASQGSRDRMAQGSERDGIASQGSRDGIEQREDIRCGIEERIQTLSLPLS